MNTRQQDIVTLVQQQGEVNIRELARRLEVSEMTIHRDLDYLEENRYLYKKRGAAVYVEQTDRDTGGFYMDEKRRIGKAAAALIQPGQSILFDNSTTALECARFLEGIPGLTFYTTNLEAAVILARYPGCVLYCSGGYYFPDSKGFTGSQAEEFVSRVHADVCVIGASGIDTARGITNPYPMHSALQRRIIEQSDFRILAADHSKFGKVAMEKAADLSEIDVIVTDSGISQEIVRQYGENVKLVIA